MKSNKKHSKTTKTTKRTKETDEIKEVEYNLQDLTLDDIEKTINDIEENIEQDNIEQDNIEQDNIELNIEQNNNASQSTNSQSFIWNYLEKLSPSEKYKKRARCLVPVIGLNREQPCGHIMGTDGSTGNFIHHLAKHRITRSTNPLQINETYNITINKKNKLDKKFVEIIIKDNQPLNIRNDEGFQEFVKALNPVYELPSDKKIKELLVDSYNYCKEEIIHLFEQGITSCSLTLDLWTSKSRAGYLGVTCSFITTQFKLCEAILVIKYLKYPHTSDTIVECFNQIIQE